MSKCALVVCLFVLAAALPTGSAMSGDRYTRGMGCRGVGSTLGIGAADDSSTHGSALPVTATATNLPRQSVMFMDRHCRQLLSSKGFAVP